LRGAAPIQHAIVLNRPFWGVSIQTLHPTKFDHGVVLKQTPIPGPEITPDDSPKDVTPRLAKEGAGLLSTVIEQGLFVHPLQPIILDEMDLKTVTGDQKVALAPKIQDVDMKIDWQTMAASDIVRRLRGFGKLWDDKFLVSIVDLIDTNSRVVFSQLEEANPTELEGNTESVQVGKAVLSNDGAKIYVKAANNTWVEVIGCKISGLDMLGSMKRLKQMLKG
jgi:methionyl-tRNA formyltransferase